MIKKMQEDHEAELTPILHRATSSEESSAMAIKLAEDKSEALQKLQQEADIHLKAYKQALKQNEVLKAKVESQELLVSSEYEREKERKA